MGLVWTDAVALLGAHSIGRGDKDFSGHEGVWSDNAQDAMVRVLAIEIYIAPYPQHFFVVH
jgi:hypothetical protein